MRVQRGCGMNRGSGETAAGWANGVPLEADELSVLSCNEMGRSHDVQHACPDAETGPLIGRARRARAHERTRVRSTIPAHHRYAPPPLRAGAAL